MAEPSEPPPSARRSAAEAGADAAEPSEPPPSSRRSASRPREEDISVEERRAKLFFARHAAERPAARPAERHAERPAEWPAAEKSTDRHTSRASRASVVAATEYTATQELTTSGIRALVSGSRRSSRLSGSSSCFDDPTCTMEVAKREVLDLLAHDPDHEPGQEAPGWRGGSPCPGGVGQAAPIGARGSPAPAPAFEIFEEELGLGDLGDLGFSGPLSGEREREGKRPGLLPRGGGGLHPR